jgi:MoaA/NifB/PqqE/SkfB family radical SAM enzyme
MKIIGVIQALENTENLQQLMVKMKEAKSPEVAWVAVPQQSCSAEFKGVSNSIYQGHYNPVLRVIGLARQEKADMIVWSTGSSRSLPGKMIDEMTKAAINLSADITILHPGVFNNNYHWQCVKTSFLEKYVEICRPDKISNFTLIPNLIDPTVTYSYIPSWEAIQEKPFVDYFIAMNNQLRSIKIDPSEACNLKCQYCHFHSDNWDNGDVGANNYYKRFESKRNSRNIMSRKVFNKIKEEILQKYPKISIDLYCNGEPTLNRELIFMIQSLKKAGYKNLKLSTNGNWPPWIDAKDIYHSGLENLSFSIDAVTEEVYRIVRPGGKLRDVENNINKLIKLNRKDKKLNIAANFTLKEANICEKKLFLDKYLDKVDFVEFYHYYGNKNYFLDLNWKPIHRSICIQPIQQLGILSDGSVWICIGGHNFETTVGNAYEQSLENIIKGERYQKILSDYWELPPEKNELCCNCEVWMPAATKKIYLKDKTISLSPVSEIIQKVNQPA